MQSHRSFDPIGIHLQVSLLGSYYYLNRLGFGAQKKLAEVLSGAESQLKQYTAVNPA